MERTPPPFVLRRALKARRLALIQQCPGRLLSAGCLLLDALHADFARASHGCFEQAQRPSCMEPREWRWHRGVQGKRGSGEPAFVAYEIARGNGGAADSRRTYMRMSVHIGTLSDARACLWRCGGLHVWLLRSQCITCFACICSPMRMRMVCVCRVFAVEGGRNS